MQAKIFDHSKGILYCDSFWKLLSWRCFFVFYPWNNLVRFVLGCKKNIPWFTKKYESYAFSPTHSNSWKHFISWKFILNFVYTCWTVCNFLIAFWSSDLNFNRSYVTPVCLNFKAHTHAEIAFNLYLISFTNIFFTNIFLTNIYEVETYILNTLW